MLEKGNEKPGETISGEGQARPKDLYETRRQDIECLESAHRIAVKLLYDGSARELINANGSLIRLLSYKWRQ